MNYREIAEMVHDLVKTSTIMSSQVRGLRCPEIKTPEFIIIQKVFAKYKLSGDTLTVGVTPQLMWG